MTRRKRFIALFIIVGFPLALIITAGLLGPYLAVDVVEERLALFAGDRGMALSYSSVGYAPFSTKFTFEDFTLSAVSQRGISSIETPEMALSINLWRYVFGSGYSFLEMEFHSPIIILNPPEVTSGGGSSGSTTQPPPSQMPAKLQTPEGTLKKLPQVPDQQKVPQPILPPQMPRKEKPTEPPTPDDEYPTLRIFNGEVYLAQGGGFALLLSDVEGVFGPETEIYFSPLGIEGDRATISGSPSSLVLPQHDLPAEKLKGVIFPSLKVNFGECRAKVGGVWSIGGEGNLDFLISGPRVRVLGIDGDFSSVDLQAVYDGKSVQMLSCDFQWGGAQWMGEGLIADLNAGEIYFRFATPLVSFNQIKKLVGGASAGQFYVVGQGAMEIVIGRTLLSPKTSFRFQRI